jgi:amidase
MWNDGIVQPHPPITRCLQKTAKTLEAAGHTIISWDPRLHRDLITCVNKMYFLDGGQEYEDILNEGNEPASPLMRWILDKGDQTPLSVSQSWRLNAERNALQLAYAAQWNAAGIDALLCPANASVASFHGESKYWGYSSVFNILDYSAAIFPVGVVEESDTWANVPRQEETMGDDDALFEKLYEAGPAKYAKAPVALQLVGRRYREEQILDMTETIVSHLKATGT